MASSGYVVGQNVSLLINGPPISGSDSSGMKRRRKKPNSAVRRVVTRTNSRFTMSHSVDGKRTTKHWSLFFHHSNDTQSRLFLPLDEKLRSKKKPWVPKKLRFLAFLKLPLFRPKILKKNNTFKMYEI